MTRIKFVMSDFFRGIKYRGLNWAGHLRRTKWRRGRRGRVIKRKFSGEKFLEKVNLED